jgi:hypothetical protein
LLTAFTKIAQNEILSIQCTTYNTVMRSANWLAGLNLNFPVTGECFTLTDFRSTLYLINTKINITIMIQVLSHGKKPQNHNAFFPVQINLYHTRFKIPPPLSRNSLSELNNGKQLRLCPLCKCKLIYNHPW